MSCYITGITGEVLCDFAPQRILAARKVLARTSAGEPVVYALVESGSMKEFRRLSLFTKLPPLHLIPLYGDRNKRSVLSARDPRRLEVIARQLAGGLADLER